MYSISNIEKTENLILQVSQLKHRVDNLENVLRNGKDVLTLEEASLYTGISRNTLYKLTSAHEIPYYKPHGKLILLSARNSSLGFVPTVSQQRMRTKTRPKWDNRIDYLAKMLLPESG